MIWVEEQSRMTSCKSPSTVKGILCSLVGNSVEGVSFKPTPSTIECPGTPPEPSSRGRRFAGSRQRPLPSAAYRCLKLFSRPSS